MDRKTFRVKFSGVEREFIVEDCYDTYAIDQALRMLTKEEEAIVYSRILVEPEVEEIDPSELN